MESKLLAGTKNIVDKTDQQQLALEQQKQEMIEQKVYNNQWLVDNVIVGFRNVKGLFSNN